MDKEWISYNLLCVNIYLLDNFKSKEDIDEKPPFFHFILKLQKAFNLSIGNSACVHVKWLS